jgi:hypothetical protein
MSSVRCLTAAVAFSLAASACLAAEPPGFVKSFAGTPYRGPVQLQIDAPGAARHVSGTASATLVDHGAGRATLSIQTRMDGPGGNLPLTLEGRYDARGWHGRGNGLQLRLSPAGKLSGEGQDPPHRYTISGHLSPTRFDVRIDMHPAGADIAPQSALRFQYALARSPRRQESPRATAAASRGETRNAKPADAPCSKVRTRMRPVANVGGGGMSMVAVPVCED